MIGVEITSILVDVCAVPEVLIESSDLTEQAELDVVVMQLQAFDTFPPQLSFTYVGITVVAVTCVRVNVGQKDCAA